MDLNVVGPSNGRALVLSNALGTTREMWDAQVPVLDDQFRVIRYEHPPRADVPSLANELLAALDQAGIGRFSFCGLSLGGMVGMWIAATAPGRTDRLVLACTTARFGTPAQWSERAAIVRAHGMDGVAREALDKWFTPAYANRDRFLAMQLQYEPEAYARGLEAIGGFDFRDRLQEIGAPTLVIAGAKDTATTPADAAFLRERIPRGELLILPCAAHLANVEQPSAFTAALLGHLGGRPVRS